ncbi:MAG TPA: hypothetical protein VMW08_00690 [Acidimicrobiales bacterium]|nr:hypothetical protein [Acidimicrobiales bacterium]
MKTVTLTIHDAAECEVLAELTAHAFEINATRAVEASDPDAFDYATRNATRIRALQERLRARLEQAGCELVNGDWIAR